MHRLIEIVTKKFTGQPLTPGEEAIYVGATMGAIVASGVVIGVGVKIIDALTQPAKDLSAKATMRRMIHRHKMIDDILADAQIV